jgi:phosphatidylserine/phosphatidylglycerophosphate/cardiolipin synthase-like enzyme
MKRLVVSVLVLFTLNAAASDTQVAFSPNGGATELVVTTIRSAHATIRMAAYSFTSEPIAVALVEAKERGVDVRLVIDRKENIRGYTAATFVSNHGIAVRAETHYAIMHDKFIVVDNKAVEEGSFNYTSAAEHRNAENVLVLHDRRVAERYASEWQKLWDESQAFSNTQR